MSLFYCLPFKYILSIYCPRLSSQEVWDTLSSFQHQKVSLSHLVWTYTWHKSELWLVTPATGPDYLTELQLQQSPLTLKQGKILNPFWKVDWVSFRVWDLKYIFFMKRKETSVSSENWICFLSATRCWCFMGLHKLFTTWLCRLSPILCTYYSPSPQSVSSYTHHTGHSILSGLAGVIFYEASAIFYSMSIVWVIQKRVMQEGRLELCNKIFFNEIALKLWDFCCFLEQTFNLYAGKLSFDKIKFVLFQSACVFVLFYKFILCIVLHSYLLKNLHLSSRVECLYMTVVMFIRTETDLSVALS